MNKTITRAIADVSEINGHLVQLSGQHGGCWAYLHKPFSQDVTFEQFSSPCRVPDNYQDAMWRTGRKLGYKGKLTSFTKGSIVREQNRGIGNQ